VSERRINKAVLEETARVGLEGAILRTATSGEDSILTGRENIVVDFKIAEFFVVDDREYGPRNERSYVLDFYVTQWRSRNQ
jgi:hypothetical protein